MSKENLPVPSAAAKDWHPDEALIARKVMAVRVGVFIDRAVSGALTSPLGTFLLAWVMASTAGWVMAFVWLCLINLGELLILGIGYRYRSGRIPDEGAMIWAQRQVAAYFLVGLCWGSSVWFFWVDGQFATYMLNLIILVAVSALCVVIMSPFRMAMLLFAAGVLLPPLLQLVVVRNPYAIQTALGLTVLFILELQYAGVARRQLIAGIEDSVRSAALVEQLSHVRVVLDQTNATLEDRNAELAEALERVRETAIHDELTGAFNRRYIVEQLDRQLALKARHGTPASIIMIDLDHFKKINDRYGHPVGDRALQEVVRAMSAELRDVDVLARFGGEEFLVLLPLAARPAACLLAERLRTAVAAIVLVDGNDEIFLRASFGVAELAAGETVAIWLRRVDLALYQAKERGRDCIVAAD